MASSPIYTCRLGNEVLFAANDGINGTELWKTDDTAAGTMLVVDLYPGSTSSAPSYLSRIGNKIVFYAQTAATGYELFETDGTAAGTVLVKDIYPGTSSGAPIYITQTGYHEVLFRANSGAGNGAELWKSDGTAAWTVEVADIYSGSSSSSPYMIDEGYRLGFGMLRNQILFRANDGTHGNELWSYDAGAIAYEVGVPCSPGATPARSATLCAEDPALGTYQRSGAAAPTRTRSACCSSASRTIRR